MPRTATSRNATIDSTPAQFKKGDRVWIIRDWDAYGTVSYEAGTVTSWGRRIATLATDAGAPLGDVLYVDQPNYGQGFMELVPFSEDPIPTALSLAGERFRARGAAIERMAAQPRLREVYESQKARLLRAVVRAVHREQLRGEAAASVAAMMAGAA